jgi:arachidonate 15-lipoxygenase
MSWRIRRDFWNRLSVAKFKGNKPVTIPAPEEARRDVAPVPLSTLYPRIPIPSILVGDHVPKDEASWFKRRFIGLQVGLYTTYSPMQPGLPRVPDDPMLALEEAYTRGHRVCFPPPALPAELQGTDGLELGELAVKGPFACCLERSDPAGFCWDLTELGRYECHPGLHPLGVRVLFQVDTATRALRAQRIESVLGTNGPGDPQWPAARRIALCAVSTYVSIVRHFNWVHLASGAPVAMATRNRLAPEHPLRIFLWPHVFGTQYSNDLVTEVQLTEAGDFVATFSFTAAGLWELLARTHADYRISVVDPERDAARRGIAGGEFDTPSQDNLEALFGVVHAHAERVVGAYYADEDAIREDTELRRWLDDLEQTIPNGVQDVLGGEVSRRGVARLVAGFIYLASVQHEALGTGLWNYQLWTDKIPVRVYEDGRREPLDVYQRLVNANFNLNVRRAQLMQDFSYLARDDLGEGLFAQFQADLAALNARLRDQPAAPWRILPEILEANINA